MLCLKEWLELDKIRTNVYIPSLERVIAEVAAEKTIRFFLESMEEEDDEPGVLDDPFSGDEDATPVDDISGQNADQEIDQADVGATKKREMAKALKNAALWMRWSGMLERKKLVDKVREFAVKKDDDSFENILGDEIVLTDAIPHLEKLGYLDAGKFKNDSSISDKKRDEIIKKAIEEASQETGNDLPGNITEEQVIKNAKRAKDDFFNILRNVFARQYHQMSHSSRNTGGGAGVKLYDTDDLANNFILRMVEKVSKRPRQKGSLKPWGGLRSDQVDFGKVGEKELESDEFVDEILDHFKRLLYKEPSKAEDERRIALSPSRGAKDQFSNRDKKSSTINVDVKKALKDQAEGRPASSLDFYTNFLKAAKEGRESLYDPESMNEKDKFRFEIMSDILSKASANPSTLSLDPSKIVATLQNYRTYFLKRSKSGPSFMSVMGSKDDDSSWDATAPTDDEKAYGRGATSDSDAGLSGRNMAPSTEAMGRETKVRLMTRFRQAMQALHMRNPKWALAVCEKFELNCSDSGQVGADDEKIMSVFAGLSLIRTSSGQIKGERKANCRSQLNAIGLDKQTVGQNISQRLGDVQKQSEVDRWIDSGLDFICQELSRTLSEPGTNNKPSVPQRSFDAQRQSPLASKITSTGRPRLVTDPETGKNRWQVG